MRPAKAERQLRRLGRLREKRDDKGRGKSISRGLTVVKVHIAENLPSGANLNFSQKALQLRIWPLKEPPRARRPSGQPVGRPALQLLAGGEKCRPKPCFLSTVYGTVEAVPFQNTIFTTG
jgi:hypothetical protein